MAQLRPAVDNPTSEQFGQLDPRRLSRHVYAASSPGVDFSLMCGGGSGGVREEHTVLKMAVGGGGRRNRMYGLHSKGGSFCFFFSFSFAATDRRGRKWK